MGLDMYLYRISKITPEQIEKVSRMKGDDVLKCPDIDYSCDVCRKEKGVYIYDDGVQDIVPFIHTVDKYVSYWDMDKVKKMAGASDGARLSGETYEGNRVAFSFWDGVNQNSIEIYRDNKELVRILQTRRKTPICLYNCEEIAYWRKAYKLQDQMYDLYEGNIQNCGFHRLNDLMREAIMEFAHSDEDYWGNGKLTREMLADTDDSCVCYHEWY